MILNINQIDLKQRHVVLVPSNEITIYPKIVNNTKFGVVDCNRSALDFGLENDDYQSIAILPSMVVFNKAGIFNLRGYLKLKMTQILYCNDKDIGYIFVIAPKEDLPVIHDLLSSIESDFNLVIITPVLEDSRLKSDHLKLEVRWNQLELIAVSNIARMGNINFG